MSSFKPHYPDKSEPYSTVSHGGLNEPSLYVSSSIHNLLVRVNAVHDNGSGSFRVTAERARELAAELIAAADSLQTVAEAA